MLFSLRKFIPRALLSVMSGRIKVVIFLLVVCLLMLVFRRLAMNTPAPASPHSEGIVSLYGDYAAYNQAVERDMNDEIANEVADEVADGANYDSLQRFLNSNSQDVLSRESDFEDDICSDALKDPYYRDLMDSYLNVWYQFVPPQSKMDPSNCWYVENFNSLPSSLIKRMKGLINFYHFEGTYNTEDRDMILTKIFSKNNTAIFSSQPTSHHFCLPNVNLIGFTKTGSTYLYQYLNSHPLLAGPHTKEGQFWRDIMGMSDPKYRQLAVFLYLYHFFDASRKIKQNPDMFTIDASVSVAFVTRLPLKGEKDICLVPLVVSETMPKIKLLVQTRNPVNRLWSDFLYFCRPSKMNTFKGLRTLEKPSQAAASLFHNYTVTALQEFRACIESGQSQFYCTALAGSYPAPQAACRKVRLGVSMYYVHLIKWFRIFPREQLLVTRLEDLASDPSGIMDEVWDFLGVTKVKLKTIDKKVKANKWSKQEEEGDDFEMFPETRKLLSEFFHPYNVRLAKLLKDKRFLWTEA